MAASAVASQTSQGCDATNAFPTIPISLLVKDVLVSTLVFLANLVAFLEPNVLCLEHSVIITTVQIHFLYVLLPHLAISEFGTQCLEHSVIITTVQIYVLCVLLPHLAISE